MGRIEAIVASAAEGKLNRAIVDAWCVSIPGGRASAFNEIALAIAKAFNAGDLTFEQADDGMNTIYGMMVEQDCVIQPASLIYEAFDAGEYDHGNGKDPIDTYTRPAIKEILEES